MAKYILRFDDFFAGMEKRDFLRISEILLKNSLPALMGVVPNWKDELPVSDPIEHDEFWATIRLLQTKGCEIALHGFTHELFTHQNMLQINPFGEFAGLTLTDQEDKIKNGLAVFADQDVQARMFMPPAHSFDRYTIQALRQAGMKLVTDGKSFFPFMYNGILFIPQISSNFRRFPWGIITICLHPQFMTEDTYKELQEFCRERKSSIVDIQYAVNRYEKMNMFEHGMDIVVRKMYALLKTRPGRRVSSLSRQ